MNAIAQILVDHGATLQSVEGDAIVAFWGAPVPTLDHAVQGCLAALAVQTEVAALHARQQHEGKPALHVRCGLQSGKLFVSALGSRGPQAYTVMGHVANIASRLESVNARLGTSILVGDATYQQAKEAIEARPVGQLKAPLSPESIMAYEVLARKGDLEARKVQANVRYLEGFAHYQARRWEQGNGKPGCLRYTMHRVDPARLDLAREFKHNPTGPHSPELQKLLKLLRWEPLAGRFVVVQPRRDGPWYLARTTGPKGHPLEIFYAHGYLTLAEAHWALFRKRWEQHTGQALVLDAEDRIDPTRDGGELTLQASSKPLLGYTDIFSVENGQAYCF